VTGPEMLTPTEAMEVDAIIGRVFKASGLVRRGIGSVRQDVNVSVRGGERVEIKGVPQTWMIEKLTSVEALRQAAMLKIKDILKERGVTDKNLKTEEFDIAKILEGSKIDVVKEALAGNKAVKAIKLTGFEGIFGMPGQPGKTFADEVSGRLKVIACLDKYPNLATSDIPEQAGFNSEIWNSLKKACNCNAGDSLVATWGSHSDVAMALSEIKLRALDAIKGVPNETRQPMKDGMTDFERILPGPDRMYPDTDSPPVEISKDYMSKLKAELPEPAYLTEDRWQKQGAPRRIAEKCVVSQYSKLFDTIIGNSPLTPEVIWGALRTLKLKDKDELSAKSAGIVAVFKAFADNKITKDSMIDILKMLRPGGEIDIEKTISERRLLDIKDKAVQDVISEFIEETADCLFKRPESRIGYICGGVKKQLNNRVDGLMLQQEITAKIK
jgi:glutamyl-tRNA(Gln) amidotransferase subunit E